jgi:putative ubiquitin-RnfH superfamily antitoxin RatB of RatAB toxin-antitoxin module
MYLNLKIELVYIPIDGEIFHAVLPYVHGLTVEDILRQSNIFQVYPETLGLPVGIFSKSVTLNTEVRPGDRVEIYRPLLSDPKEKRRQRAGLRQKLV